MVRRGATAPTSSGRTSSSLPDESEKALLHVLVSKADNSLKFKSLCDRRPEVFGTPASDLRRKVQKRRDYLIAHPEVFQVAIQSIVVKQEEQQRQEEEPTPDDYSHSSLSQLIPQYASPGFVAAVDEDRRIIASRRRHPQSQAAFITPLSPPLPRNIMSHLDKVSGPSYQLYIEQFWKNPNGMLAIRGNEVVQENTVVDKLSIMKPIFDMDDFDLKLYSARLNDGGTGIIVTEPTIPGYLWRNPAKIQELVDDGAPGGICKKTELTYKTIRIDMKKNREYRSHEVTYFFPQGVTCNNELFNGSSTKGRRSDHFELDTEMFVYEVELGKDQDDNDIVQFCPFIVWRMAIDGAARQTEDDDDGVRGASKALARLGIKVGEKPTKSRDVDLNMDDM
jgi:hypothetical protein